MIKRVIIKNFKGIKNADIELNTDKSILVGNNGVGKSTVIEALCLALGYGLNQFEITPYIFHNSTWKDFLDNKTLPEIIIEVYFEDDEKYLEFVGKNNSLHEECPGIVLRVFCDEDYKSTFEKEKDNYKEIPCEFYITDRFWFSQAPVKQFKVPFTPLIIDSTSSYFNSRTNQFATHIIESKLSDSENAIMKGCLRRLKETFENDSKMKDVNKIINKQIEDIRSGLQLSVDLTTKKALDSILYPALKSIPFDQIGLGEQCIIKTLLSMKKVATDKENIVLIEEPESHLSHTKMYELLEEVSDKCEGQLIVTTHNSYIANKLSFDKVIILGNEQGNIKTEKIDINKNPYCKYFTKVSNYPTLRVALCEKAILVEGPSDEMIIQYYFKKIFNCHPYAKNIELISVDSLAFKPFISLGDSLKKKIAVITDNDGKTEEKIISSRIPNDSSNSIKLFTEKNQKLNTLEPSFVNANKSKLQELSNCIRNKKDDVVTEESIVEYMEKNKADWAYKVLTCDSQVHEFNCPQYIIDAVNWIIQG